MKRKNGIFNTHYRRWLEIEIVNFWYLYLYHRLLYSFLSVKCLDLNGLCNFKAKNQLRPNRKTNCKQINFKWEQNLFNSKKTSRKVYSNKFENEILFVKPNTFLNRQILKLCFFGELWLLDFCCFWISKKIRISVDFYLVNCSN